MTHTNKIHLPKSPVHQTSLCCLLPHHPLLYFQHLFLLSLHFLLLCWLCSSHSVFCFLLFLCPIFFLWLKENEWMNAFIIFPCFRGSKALWCHFTIFAPSSQFFCHHFCCFVLFSRHSFITISPSFLKDFMSSLLCPSAVWNDPAFQDFWVSEVLMVEGGHPPHLRQCWWKVSGCTAVALGRSRDVTWRGAESCSSGQDFD